ncbi:hypothetical protein HDU90_005796 [Geranomyces variabilis]|nr:hypothetical protein HDU90_005796 [Geranomyces variabilis]
MDKQKDKFKAYVTERVQNGTLDPVKFCEHFKFKTEQEAARLYQTQLKNLADRKFKGYSAARKEELAARVQQLSEEQVKSIRKQPRYRTSAHLTVLHKNCDFSLTIILGQATPSPVWTVLWTHVNVTSRIRADAAKRQAFHSTDLVAAEQGREKRRRFDAQDDVQPEWPAILPSQPGPSGSAGWFYARPAGQPVGAAYSSVVAHPGSEAGSQ